MRIHGSACLVLMGRRYESEAAIDLSAGHIELLFERDALQTGLVPFDILFTVAGKVSLENIRLATPSGSLLLDHFDDFFVVQYEPEWVSPEKHTDLSRRVFIAGALGVSRLVLQPRKSLLTFGHGPDGKRTDGRHEIVFDVSAIDRSQQFELTVDGNTVDATIRGSELILNSATSLLERQDGILTSYGMISGGPASLRSYRDGENVAVDLSPHSNGSIERLWMTEADAPKMLQAFVTFFCSRGAHDLNKWHRAAALHLHGLGDKVLLDQRILTLYTSLEMLDGTSTLSKTGVAPILQITEPLAALVCEIRHALIHDGASISEAVIERSRKVAMYTSSPVDLGFSIDSGNRSRVAQRYYFWLASKLNAFWLRKVNFTGQFNDYSNLFQED